MSVLMYCHFHKDFPYNENSTWLKPSYAFDGGWRPNRENDFVNVCLGENTILKYKKYYPEQTDLEFLKAMGQQATEYYVANMETDADYLGVSSYRRCLLLDENKTDEKITMSATKETCVKLTSDSEKEKIISHFERGADVIINRAWTINTSVENQYLTYELPEYWTLFKEAILKTNIEYKNSMSWFDSNVCNFEGVYVMRKNLIQKMLNEYFCIMEYIWENCSEVYPDKNKKQYNCSEPLPWRYPGFLNERFVPFFIHANNLKKTEVPLVFLS
jgi:hypothetical protein